MKNWIHFFFWGLLATQSLGAQTWFNAGDKWAYNVTTGWDFQNYGIHTIDIGGDTVINGVNWRRINYHQITNNYILYGREENDKVYARYSFSDDIYLNYDFSSVPGDTVRHRPDRFYIVTDTGSLYAAGHWRRTQTVNFGEPSGALIVEGIGITGLAPDSQNSCCSFLLPHVPFCDASFDGNSAFFQCYENGEGFQFSPLNACAPSGTTALIGGGQMDFFPNPASNFVQFSTEFMTIRLFQLDGHCILNQVMDGSNTIYLNDLPNSLYLVKGETEHGGIFYGKLVVQR